MVFFGRLGFQASKFFASSVVFTCFQQLCASSNGEGDFKQLHYNTANFKFYFCLL